MTYDHYVSLITRAASATTAMTTLYLEARRDGAELPEAYDETHAAVGRSIAAIAGRLQVDRARHEFVRSQARDGRPR